MGRDDESAGAPARPHAVRGASVLPYVLVGESYEALAVEREPAASPCPEEAAPHQELALELVLCACVRTWNAASALSSERLSGRRTQLSHIPTMSRARRPWLAFAHAAGARVQAL